MEETGMVPEQVDEQVEATATEEPAPETQDGEHAEETEEHPEEPTEKPKTGINKRFSELTAARKAAEQYAAKLEEQNRQLMEFLQKQGQPEAPKPPQPVPNVAPDRYDFDNDAAYQQAMDAYIDAQFQRRFESMREQATKARQEQEQRRQQEEQQKKIGAIVNKGAEKYEDFQEVAYVPTQLMDIVANTENPEEIAYRWGRNPAEWQEIMQLPPYAAAVRIGKLDAELSARAKKQTQAPPPVKPVGGKVEAAIDPDKLPINEWLKLREAGKI